MRSRSIGVYTAVALISIVVYVIVAFSRGTAPKDPQEWVAFSLMGLVLAAIASAVIGTLVVARGRRITQTTKSG